MDNLLEVIVPLIFAAIYFFGNMLSGKKESEDAPTLAPRESDGGAADEEAAERQRRIQEEIRRKIMERRQANSGSAPVPVAPPPRPRPVAAERAPVVPPLGEPVPQRRSSEEWDAHQHSAQKESGANVFWELSDDTYARGIEDRMRRIEATKRQAEQLKRRADAATRKSSPSTAARSADRSGARLFTGSVRQNLQNPAAARAAFIYGEVLGRPVSMRESGGEKV